MSTYSYDRTAGEGDDSKTIPAAIAWINRLESLAKKAKQELKSKGDPGMAMNWFVGHMKGYRDEDWYEHFYG